MGEDFFRLSGNVVAGAKKLLRRGAGPEIEFLMNEGQPHKTRIRINHK